MQRRFKDFFTRDKKALYMILGIVLISVFSLTIVYAALSVTLNITGSTEITASNWDIHLANPTVKSGSVSSITPSISGNNLSFSANLTKPGEFYEFTVDVVNDGTIDAMIDSVVKTPELTTAQAKYLKYEISYANGESINTKQTIKSKTKTPIKVRIEYRNDLSASDLPSTTTNLSLKLTLIYVQSDGSGSEIKDNGVYNPIRVVSGDGTQVGNEICIKDECFYVISSDTDSVTMLSKYNLYVGGVYNRGWTAYGDEATGKQDSTMLGYRGQPIRNGVTSFSSTDQHGTNYTDYRGSIVEGYVNNYNNYLITQGVTPIEARLITKDELKILGCSEENYNCNRAPDWVWVNAYWSMSAADALYVWTVSGDGSFCDDWYSDNSYFGVRPVVTISRSLIDSTGSSATKRLIEFTIEGITYQAEEGMTWGEWVDSEYSTESFSIDADGYVCNGDIQLNECVKPSDMISSDVTYTNIKSGIACNSFVDSDFE